ncbi:hypothetical protein AB9M62_29115 [Bacillales bacterium AN1005]
MKSKKSLVPLWLADRGASLGISTFYKENRRIEIKEKMHKCAGASKYINKWYIIGILS